MNDEDVRALTTLDEHNKLAIDVGLLNYALKTNGLLSQSQFDSINKTLGRVPFDRRLPVFLLLIKNFLTLKELVHSLNSIGLYNVSRAILDQRQCRHIKTPNSSEYPQDHYMTNFYRAVSRKFGNKHTVVSLPADFQTMSDLLASRLSNERSDRLRQKDVDLFAVLVSVRVFIYDDVSERNAILLEMMTLEDRYKELDTRVIRIVYLISKCYVERKKGSLSEAEMYLSQAHQLCCNHGSSLLRYLVFTAEHALYRNIYLTTKNEAHKTKSLTACDNAVHVLNKNISGFKEYVNKFLQLCKVLALLEFGQELAVDPELIISQSDLMSAKHILDDLQIVNLDLDNKQQVLYRVCMARIHMKKHPQLANANICMALDLHAQISETEKANILRLRDFINERIQYSVQKPPILELNS